MIEFNNWLIQNADKTTPAMTIIDTTKVEPAKSVKEVKEWVGNQSLT